MCSSILFSGILLNNLKGCLIMFLCSIIIIFMVVSVVCVCVCLYYMTEHRQTPALEEQLGGVVFVAVIVL